MKIALPEANSARRGRPIRCAIWCVFAAVLAGCGSVAPIPVTEQDVVARLQDDRIASYSGQEPVAGQIGFYEAIARGIKYNLDLRLKRMETAMAAGLSDYSKLDMLPQLVASAGYTQRSNDASSYATTNNIGSSAPSTSQDRQRWLAGAEFSWNALDFGIGYQRAKQQADQFLIADERRKRVMQNLVQDIRSAYWRAVGAQRLTARAEQLMARVQTALVKSRHVEQRGLLPPAQALAFQRALLDSSSMLMMRRQELDFAKRELGALLNIPPGTDFTLAEQREPVLPDTPTNVYELEEMALFNRPELREEDYRKRISAAEARKQLIALLPNLSASIGARYDSNDHLASNRWIDAGTSVSWNLLKPFAYDTIVRMDESQQQVDQARRMALSMAILTQVRVALQRYNLARSDYELAEETARVDQRLAAIANASTRSRTDSELEEIRLEARALVSQYQLYSSYANAQIAYGRIANSLGLDALPGDVGDVPIRDIAAELERHMAEAERKAFKRLFALLDTYPALAVRVSESASLPAIDMAHLTAVIERALQRSGLQTAAPAATPWTLDLTIGLESIGDGSSRGVWRYALNGKDAKQGLDDEYTTYLPRSPQASTIDAFAEAAVLANAQKIKRWLLSQQNRQ